MGPWPPDPGEVGASIWHSFSPGPGGGGGYKHNAVTSKAGEVSEAEGVKTLAENKESTATPTIFYSFRSNDSARALAPAPAPKIATVRPWPPDPGRAEAFNGPSWPSDPGEAEATCTGA